MQKVACTYQFRQSFTFFQRQRGGEQIFGPPPPEQIFTEFLKFLCKFLFKLAVRYLTGVGSAVMLGVMTRPAYSDNPARKINLFLASKCSPKRGILAVGLAGFRNFTIVTRVPSPCYFLRL